MLIDGEDLKNLNLAHFRQQVGYVGQEPVLLNTTIKDNIRFCKPGASEAEIKQALASARALKFVEKNKQGLDLVVGNQGGSLSGGQKQRIALAQSFVKKPKILLLDEATSALDRKNEL